MRPSSSSTRSRRVPGTVPRRCTTPNTTPSDCDSSAWSRCSGSMTWWLRSDASRCAAASASWDRRVSLLRSMAPSPSLSVDLSHVVQAGEHAPVGSPRGRAVGLLALRLALHLRHRATGPVELRLSLVEAALHLHDDPDPGEVDALVLGQPLDLAEPLDVALRGPARVAGGALRGEQTLPLVDPQRLGMHARQVGCDADDVEGALLVGARRLPAPLLALIPDAFPPLFPPLSPVGPALDRHGLSPLSPLPSRGAHAATPAAPRRIVRAVPWLPSSTSEGRRR